MAQSMQFSTQGRGPVDWSARWAKLGDIGLLACMFLMPLFLGGRHDLGRLVYAFCVLIATVGVFTSLALAGKQIKISLWAIGLFSAAVGLLVLQSVPLPEFLLKFLAPGQEALLPLWQGSTDQYSLGSWRTLSFTPSETREGAALLSLHGLLFITVYARLRSRDDVQQMLSWVAYATVAMAAFGLLQYATSNDKLLWFYAHPSRDIGAWVQGAFANKNHFAHFLVLGLGPLMWLSMKALNSAPSTKSRGKKKAIQWNVIALFGAVALVVTAALASQSRGGAITLTVGAATAVAMQWSAGMLKMKQAIGLSVLVFAALGGVSLFGYEQVTGRLDDLVSGEIEQLDANEGRRLIWQANADAFNAWPLVGAGAGGHSETYPLYLEKPIRGEFTHAESGYLQVASETGLLGIALLFLTFGTCLIWVLRGALRDAQKDRLDVWSAIVPSLMASAVHSVVDFVWYIPSLLVMTLIVIACAARQSDFAVRGQEQKQSRPSRSWFMPTMSSATVALGSIFLLFGPGMGAVKWDQYLRCSSSLKGLTTKLIQSEGEPQDRYLPETIKEHTRLATELLEQIVSHDPYNARAHSRLAGRYLQRFEIETADHENQMPISWIRDAAIQSEFATREEMVAWIRRAYGEQAELLIKAHTHARLAVELCPLQGEAYMYLAKLSMFESQSSQATLALTEQGMKVRPYEGGVLFEAGRQYSMAGVHQPAQHCWFEALRRPGSHREKLVALLAATTPADELIENLQPDRPALDLAIKHYQLLDSEADLRLLAHYAMQQAQAAEQSGEEKPQHLAARWRQTSSVLRSIKEFKLAVQCAERSMLLSPYDFYVRLELATSLYQAEKYMEADPHLRWCLARRPDLKYLQRWLTDAAKQRTQVAQNRKARFLRKSALSTPRPWDAISPGKPHGGTASEVATRPEETLIR